MSTEIGTSHARRRSNGLENAAKQGAQARCKMVGWFSVGMAVATIGILVGAELRSRYKFNRRTPYDFYANAGEQQASEFGVGI